MSMERTKRWFAVIMICSSMLIMSGSCAKKKVETVRPLPAVETDRQVLDEPVAFPDDVRPIESNLIQEDEPEEKLIRLALGHILFDFDRDLIRSDAKRVLNENIRLLKENPKAKIIIQGHADERGTNEYNLALGERRVQTAKRYLLASGIELYRIRTISYGEERPFCFERNERCWQENRRGHFALAN
jgi:peptidoglycan-associated lipoprotein